MTTSLISVIVPVYNVEKYLRKCLDSIVNQTYTNLEIICVNDGSKDSSRMILQEYAEKDQRIRVIDKENGGLSDARNTGLDHVKGEYIMFVDSDDWLELTACEKSIYIAEKYHVDVVMWPYIREFEKVSLKKEIFDQDIYFNEADTHNKIYRRFFGLYGEELAHPENADALVTVWGKLYRSELILKNNIVFVDTKEIGTCEDTLFNIEVFSYVTSSYFLNRALYHYRKTNTSFTTGYNSKLKEQWSCLYKKMKKIIERNNLNDEFYEALSNRIALNVIGLGFNILGNRKGFLKKCNEIRAVLYDPVIHKSIKKLNTQYFPVHWRVFFYFVKIRLTIAVYLLIMIMNQLRSR